MRRIKKKEYYAHCNSHLYTTTREHSHILELTYKEWLQLYLKDKNHWFNNKKWDNNFQTFKYNPIYSKDIFVKDDVITYEDFCIIFSSFKDYKLYIKFISKIKNLFENNYFKDLLIETINKKGDFDYKTLKLRIKAITNLY